MRDTEKERETLGEKRGRDRVRDTEKERETLGEREEGETE